MSFSSLRSSAALRPETSSSRTLSVMCAMPELGARALMSSNWSVGLWYESPSRPSLSEARRQASNGLWVGSRHVPLGSTKRFAGLRYSFGRHRNRWWQTSRGPLLDSGAFVAGLEYAAGIEADVVGKPTQAYFDAALAELGASPDEAVMVGDDVEADIGGAKAAGLRAVLVRTGKFREETLAGADPQPDGVVASIADVPAFLRETG
jgi:HAD-hyrolase-like